MEEREPQKATVFAGEAKENFIFLRKNMWILQVIVAFFCGLHYNT